MDYVAILQSLVAKWHVVGGILMALGMLVIVGQVVVVATPTKKDDEAWAKIKAVPILGSVLAALEHFAPIQKK